MKFEILQETDNRLLDRKQYTVKITESLVTPKREDVWKSFAAKQGLDEKRLIVDTLKNKSGTREVIANLRYYDNEKVLKKIEVKSNVKIWKRLNGIEDKSVEGKSKEEKPKEDKPQTQDSKPKTQNPKLKEDMPKTADSKPKTPNPELKTQNPKLKGD